MTDSEQMLTIRVNQCAESARSASLDESPTSLLFMSWYRLWKDAANLADRKPFKRLQICRSELPIIVELFT